jgi:hypothetical protein
MIPSQEFIIALQQRLGVAAVDEAVAQAMEQHAPVITAEDRARFCGCGKPEQHTDGNP